ncbi:hypothetical protein ACQBAT_10830 [Ornithinimicrobium sp. Y1847]|uniref:hypothetical protein n=1 Tax=unclassified Ornithinimicrobium TaxID=2615080 RepID=UPI003B6789CB
MKTTWAIAVLVLALLLVLESWASGYLPGDPDGVATRMRNVISLGGIAAGLGAASFLPIGMLRYAVLALATLAVLAALAYRLEVI